MGIFGKSKTQLKWREPWMMRLRLHRDLVPRLILCLACSVAAGSIFYLAAHLEGGRNDPLIGAALGFVTIGGVITLGIMVRPESLMGSVVRVSEAEIRRDRHSLDIGNALHVRQRWPFPSLTCAIVPPDAVSTPFAVLVMPGEKQAVFIGIPQRVVGAVHQRLSSNGAHVVLAPELADMVREARPDGRQVVRWVVAAAGLVTLSTVAATMVF